MSCLCVPRCVWCNRYEAEWTIDSLPDEVCQLRELRSLQLNHCVDLEALPNTVGTLTNLEHLALCGNKARQCKLATLPDSFAQLASLTELDLSATSLTRLPPSVGMLPALKRLNMGHCTSLTSLGDALPPLLERVSLNDCYGLESLPEALSGLAHLHSLHLNECGLLERLPSVERLTELTELSLVGCGGLLEMPHGLKQRKGCCVLFDDGPVVIGGPP